MSSYQLTPGSRLSSWPAYAEQANHTWLVRLQDNLWEAPPGGAPGTIPESVRVYTYCTYCVHT